MFIILIDLGLIQHKGVEGTLVNLFFVDVWPSITKL
jgi:hypothetical protein